MIDKKPRRRALSNLGGAVTSSGEPGLARLLEEAFARAAHEDADTLTHGFHTYPARMHPAVPRVLLEALAQPGTRVLDPFCGSGTTLVEARTFGLPAAGVDLNPLALRVAEVKCRTPDDEARAAFGEALFDVARASEARVKARAPSRAPLAPDDVRRYDAHVLRELAGLLDEIRAVEDEDIRRALEVVFSAIAVKFSRQRADTVEEGSQKRIGRFIPTRFFERKGEELLHRWEVLSAHVPKGAPAPRLALGDARRLPALLGRKARYDLVVSSPPYGGTYDYHAHHRLRLAWLGLKEEELRTKELGARRRLSRAARGREAAEQWDEEVLAFLGALEALLTDDAVVVLLMGDGEVAGRRVPADAQFSKLAPEAGLAVVALASEPRKDWRGGPPRKEHLLALRPRR